MKARPTTTAALLALSMVLTGCERPAPTTAEFAAPAAAPADLVFLNGGVYTVDGAGSWVEAVAVRGGEITVAGSNREARAFIGDHTRVVDLDGKMLLPGFHDSHIHLVSGGLVQLGCDLAEIYAHAELLARLGECRTLAGLGEEGWITGGVWDRQAFADAPPHRALLDAYFPERPAYLEASDGHSTWVNTRALEIAGIDRHTPDPPNGEIARDPATGEPTGILNESAMALVRDIMPAPTPEENFAAIGHATAQAHAFGITSVIEAGLDVQSLEPLIDLDRSGALQLRILASLSPIGWTVSALDDRVFAMLETGRALERRHLRTDSVKFFLDGVLETGTALLVDPYERPEFDLSAPIYDQAVLDALFTRLDAEGNQIHVHAIGDGGVRSALDAFEVAREANGPRDNRHHIVHLQLIHPDDVHRFAELNVTANFQALWAYPDYWIMELNLPEVGRERVERMYPIASVLRSGGRIVGGSDWTVSSLNPLDAIETAVRRQDADATGGAVLNESERVDLAAMIEAYTSNGAWLMKQEDSLGSIAVGKRADLVVLDRNLFDIPVTQINQAGVLLTVFDGEIVYDAAEPRSEP